jgi:hypothetical protein
MRGFDAGMVILGLALGTYWLRILKPMRSRFVLVALLAVTAVLLTALTG